jgi:hypothetical protein
MKLTRYNFVIALSALILCPGSASAQIYFGSGSPYNQRFDSLATTGTNTWTDNSTLPGWYASKTAGGSAVTAYRAGYGNDTAGALYSFGIGGSGPATDRALGSLASGTPGDFAYGVRFSNDTSQVITNLTIDYVGEQWRNGGSTATQTLAFAYQISSNPILTSDAANTTAWTPFTALDFNSPTASANTGLLDGNANTNRHTFANVLLPDVVVFPGQEIFFRWLDINDTGNDHALAIDNFILSWTTVAPFTNPPSITTDPQNVTNNAGTTATFTVKAGGTSLTYLWRKNGADLFDDTKHAGCLTPTLMVSNLVAADAGQYTVVVANDVGSRTSAVAVLTVIDPTIIAPPLSRTAIAGDIATLSVSADGTHPLSYQWRQNGTDLAGGTSSRLTFTGINAANQGNYTVVVSNALGNAITSSVATLTVLATPATLLAQWDFNNTNALAADAPDASIGSGTAAIVANKGSFTGGSSSDPAGAPGSSNSGWNSTKYPSQGTSNKLSGVQFSVSTAGYQDLLLTWEQRHSNTASKYARLQYSPDGATFVDGPLITMTATDNSYVHYSANLAGIPSLNDNANFAFRIVSEFESTAIGTTNANYVGTAGAYGTQGTIRFDLVRVFANAAGTVVPIKLNFSQVGSSIVLNWANPAFSLASSTNASGPFTKITGASSPYTSSASGPATFFRLVYP